MQNRIENIEKKLLKKERVANQPGIKIRDIVAYQVSPSCLKPPQGEFIVQCISSRKFDEKKAEAESTPDFINRIVDYIVNLASRAERIHVKDNFFNPDQYVPARKLYEQAREKVKKQIQRDPSDEEVQAEFELMLEPQRKLSDLNPDNLDNITRLSLNEFALYPEKNRGPINLKDFQTFIEKLVEEASLYPANFHLVLASIPVFFVANQVQNMGIYVECGKTPRIHTFAKAVPSHIDPVYPNTVNPAFTRNYDDNPVPAMASLFSKNENINFNYGGNIIFKTAGGKLARVGVEICLDNYHGIALQNVLNDIEMAERKSETILPLHATHLVVSNFIQVTPEALISKTVTQTDPVHSKVSAMAGNTEIKQESRKEIINPIFGSTTMFDVYPPREIKGHHKQLKKNLDSINKFNIKLDALKKARALHVKDKNHLDKKIDEHIIYPLLKLLRTQNDIYEVYIEKLQNLYGNRADEIPLLEKLGRCVAHENNLKPHSADKLAKVVANTHERIKQDLHESSLLSKITESPLNEVKSKVICQDFSVNKSDSAKKQNELPEQNTDNFEKKTKEEKSSWYSNTPKFDFHRPVSTFLQPLPCSEKIQVLRYVGHHFIFKFLPWNKKTDLTTQERNLLVKNLAELSQFKKRFNLQKQKRAYQFGVNADKYHDVAIRIKHAKLEINTILNQKAKTPAQLHTIKTHLQEIEILLPQLTNQQIEKELRYEEIHIARQRRRARGR